MFRVPRWIHCLPLGFIASRLVGAAATWCTQFLGGSTWYVRMLNGAGSAWAFFFVSMRVAPAATSTLRWVTVANVSVLGAMVALGPIMANTGPIRFITGVTMVVIAVGYAQMSPDAIRADTKATIGT